jgi:hypothetical protein
VDATQPEGTASRLERLTTLRASIEATLAGDVPVRDFAALSREYRAVLAEIAELAPPEQKGDAVDEIAQRRAARRAGPAKGAVRAKRPS